MFRSIRNASIAAAVAGCAILAVSTAPFAHAETGAMAPTDKTSGMGHQSPAGEKVDSSKDIIEIATGPGMTEVSTVVAAIKAAGLVDTLKGPGPFTVFAPTNAAFEKLPKGTVEDLLKPENKEKLKSILLYHVHSGDAIKAADVKTMSLSTANGQPIAVKAEGGNVMLNDAKVIKTDVVAKNGVIHWIDTVLLPKPAGGM
jgi:uncharacterized surface protein with fasciclin (FAS1) repeats